MSANPFTPLDRSRWDDARSEWVTETYDRDAGEWPSQRERREAEEAANRKADSIQQAHARLREAQPSGLDAPSAWAVYGKALDVAALREMADILEAGLPPGYAEQAAENIRAGEEGRMRSRTNARTGATIPSWAI